MISYFSSLLIRINSRIVLGNLSSNKPESTIRVTLLNEFTTMLKECGKTTKKKVVYLECDIYTHTHALTLKHAHTFTHTHKHTHTLKHSLTHMNTHTRITYTRAHAH